MSRLRLALPFVAALAPACFDFHLTGPEDAPEVNAPRLVSVAIEYRQPAGCLNAATPCDEPVVFFGSWMRPGTEFRLARDAGGHLWRGVARGVPVNFPPLDHPYSVRVFDAFLRETCTEGFQAERLRVGGEALTRFDGGGCREQAALVYIDENGRGRNPY